MVTNNMVLNDIYEWLKKKYVITHLSFHNGPQHHGNQRHCPERRVAWAGEEEVGDDWEEWGVEAVDGWHIGEEGKAHALGDMHDADG